MLMITLKKKIFYKKTSLEKDLLIQYISWLGDF
jgi:hypothetical protein